MPSAHQIRRWLDVASRAPSYHNLQPWRCVLEEDAVVISVDDERGFHVLGRNGRASLLSLGAFWENLAVAAAADGSEVVAVVEGDDPRSLTLRATFAPAAASDAATAARDAAIARETNRRAPDDRPLPPGAVASMAAACEQIDGCRLVVTDDDGQRADLAEALSAGATLALYNPKVHDELFTYNRWTTDDAIATRDGIDARTLEIDDEAAAWLQRVAPYEVFASQVDPDAILAGAITPLVASPHLAVVVGQRSPPVAATLAAGRAMGRMWNQAAAAQVALQPFGVLLLYDLEDRPTLEATCDEEELEQIDALLSWVADLVGVTDDQQPYFACRLFCAAPASTRSLRRPVEAFTTVAAR